MTRELMGQKLKQFFSNKTIVFCLIFTILFLLAGYVKWFEIAQGIISILAFIILPVQSAFSFFQKYFQRKTKIIPLVFIAHFCVIR